MSHIALLLGRVPAGIPLATPGVLGSEVSHGHTTELIGAHRNSLYHARMTAVVAAHQWAWLAEEMAWPASYR